MDDLVLNLALDDQGPAKPLSGKKGGRWTERLKVKRVLKRKTRHDDTKEQRPSKRLRQEHQTTESVALPQPRPQSASRPTQVISSLFTYNPKVNLPAEKPRPEQSAAPSNAPLDSSTFSGLGLNPLLISHLTNKMGIQKPTAIQRAALPVFFSTLPDTHARDVFIQSQTGSGKTLSYLLPIIQDLLPLSSLSYIDRSIGTLAIIIAPTRELAKQISDVLESLLKMRLRPEDDSTTEPDTSIHLTRWLVSGLLVGGATRTHEKARLRKGVPILVSTPGRLLDHLQNTSSFNVGKCRWLVLDEADQLMELGFEETVKGIIQGLDGRRRLAKQAMLEGKTMEVNDWDWERRRRTILCSATIREDVQKLAGTTLIAPRMVKATEADKDTEITPAIKPSGTETFTPPSQLSQKYVVVPLKLRLVTLVALLRTLLLRSQSQGGSRVIVFLSCADSVDFHWHLLANSTMDGQEESQVLSDLDESDENTISAAVKRPDSERVEARCTLLPDTTIYRLHGSLPTGARLAALKGFSRSHEKGNKNSQKTPSVLFCTSVASRGLDLPLVRAVIQYDLPTEGGPNEYVHRVGRTARAGKGGEAWSFVAPSEVDWVKWVEGKMRGADDEEPSSQKAPLTGVPVETVLKTGFGGKGAEFEARATEVQLAFERWVLCNKGNATLAKSGFLSHMRAYATHPSNEKHIFHIRNLHLGHLAKAFALRDAPKSVKANASSKPVPKNGHPTKARNSNGQQVTTDKEWDRDHSGEAEKRMQAIVRAQGRLTKRGGMMTSSGAAEFQISGGADLEKLLNG